MTISTDRSIRIIQLSDLHLFENPSFELLQVNTQKSLEAVLALLKNERIDLIILSGDLSQDGSKGAYLRISDLFEPFKIPVYYFPGNHDNRKVMEVVYPKGVISNERNLVFKNWQIILLDSQKENAVEGYLDSKQFEFLAHCLKSHPNHRAIVMFHHQPFLIDCAWLDNLGLTNADKFWRIVKHYPKIQTVVFGHIHQVLERTYNDVQCLSAPSTCFQFKPRNPGFALDNLPPGFRWLELFEDGTLKTGITRTDKYIGIFDENSLGYK